MTAHAIVAREPRIEWTVVRGDWYTMEPSDFPEGCGIVFNPDTGVQFGIGKSRLGRTVKVRLYHPLCNGCDKPIPSNGVCDDCQALHADVAEMGL